MSKNVSVYGVFPSRLAVEEAVDALKAEGYRNTDISVLFSDNQGTKDFAVEKHTKAPEGTTAGAVSGGAIGGALGWLAGIGVLAIPGIGPLVAAGPIVAALTGVGAGAIGGGIIGALVGLGVPEFEAKRYEGRIRKGGILLSVHCDNGDWASRAKDILRRAGAEDVSSSGEAKADFAAHEKPLPRTRTEAALREERSVVEDETERLRVRRAGESPFVDEVRSERGPSQDDVIKREEELRRTKVRRPGEPDPSL